MKIRRLLNKITDYIAETAHLNKTFYENEKKPPIQTQSIPQDEWEKQMMLQVAEELRRDSVDSADNHKPKTVYHSLVFF